MTSISDLSSEVSYAQDIPDERDFCTELDQLSRPLYPSQFEVEQKFRFISDSEKAAVEKICSIPQTAEPTVQLSYPSRTKTYPTSNLIQEHLNHPPPNNQLDTDIKSKIRVSLQETDELFSDQNFLSGPNYNMRHNDHLPYPSLNRSATDHLPINRNLYPGLSNEIVVTNGYLSPMDFSIFEKLSIEGRTAKISKKNTKNKSSSNKKDDVKRSNKTRRSNKETIESNSSSKQSNSVKCNKFEESSEETCHYSAKEKNDISILPLTEVFIDKKSALKHKLKFEKQVPSGENFLSDKLLRSVSDSGKKEYKLTSIQQRWQFVTKKDLDFNKKLSLGGFIEPRMYHGGNSTKNLEKKIKGQGQNNRFMLPDSRQSITCLGCMRILIAKNTAKLISCPVCRVVTPVCNFTPLRAI